MKFTELAKIIEEKQPMKQGAGVLVFHAPTKEFLLQKRGPNVTDPGQYDFFGGGVDDGESVLDAAYRETAEEGGFTVDPKEAFYPLAIYGKKPEEGLGGYHIFLVVVYKKFPLQINYDPDMPGEVESADWMDSEALKKVHLHHRVRTLFADPGFKDSLLKAVQKRYALFERSLRDLFRRKTPAERDRAAIRKYPEQSQAKFNSVLAGAAKQAYRGGYKELGDKFSKLRVAFSQAIMLKDYDKAVDVYDAFFDLRERIMTTEDKEKCKYGRRKDGKCRKQPKRKNAYRGGYGFLGHRFLTKPTPPGGMDDGMNGMNGGMNGAGNGAGAGAPAPAGGVAAGGAGAGAGGAGGAGAGGAGAGGAGGGAGGGK